MTDEEKIHLEKLKEFVAYYANCPCCERSDVCADGCSFERDCPEDWEVMQQARELVSR